MLRHSKYWDDFDKRINETVNCIKANKPIPVRRVAVFITNNCNFKCDYCNIIQRTDLLTETMLDDIVTKYKDAIIHITGGEPSIVPWLYDYIDSHLGRFHLNTNGYIEPPKNIQRLKVSLDSMDAGYFNSLVHKKAFDRVVENIKNACKYTVVSITCTLTKETYKQAPEFMKWCRQTFPDLYAVFFSVYKGENKRFAFAPDDIKLFFNKIKPSLEDEMDAESLALFRETVDEKIRIMQGIRFPENRENQICYISMSERVIDHTGIEFNCSHLYRDNILQMNNDKNAKCLYGCNRRLVEFNKIVERELNK